MAFLSGEELAYGIDLAECKLVLADEGRARTMLERPSAQRQAGAVQPRQHPPPEGLADVLALPEGTSATPWRCWARSDRTISPRILYTSGSTAAVPRVRGRTIAAVVHGVMSYVAQSAMAKVHSRKPGRTDDRSALRAGRGAIVPMSPAKCPLFLQSFAIARKLVLMPKWDVGLAIRLMAEEKVTYFVGVPLMSYEIANHPDRGQYDLSACKSFAAGGAPRPVGACDPDQRKPFPGGFPLLGYGLTETNAVGCGNFNENYLAKPGSTGRASKPIGRSAHSG